MSRRGRNFLAQAPLSDTVRRDIARVYTERVDYLPGLSKEEKLAKLGKISYAEYLLKYCKLAPEALSFFQTFTHDLFCLGIDAVSARACYEAGDDYRSFTYPGLMGWNFQNTRKRSRTFFIFRTAMRQSLAISSRFDSRRCPRRNHG